MTHGTHSHTVYRSLLSIVRTLSFTMPSISYTVVDAFTPIPFKGNPAAVIVLHSPLPDSALQSIAAEFNLSETAFITPVDAPNGKFGLRWFTPQKEVDLCGHATLASARVLFSNRDVLPSSVQLVEFQTNVSGILTGRLLEDGRVELELPAGVPTPASDEREAIIRESIIKAFGDLKNLEIKAVTIGANSPYEDYLIIEVNEDFLLEGAKITNMDAIVGTPFSSLLSYNTYRATLIWHIFSLFVL